MALVAERSKPGGTAPVIPPSFKRRLATAEAERKEATKEAAAERNKHDALKMKWGWLLVNAGEWAPWIRKQTRRPARYNDRHTCNGAQ